jgi:hypothetical protein
MVTALILEKIDGLAAIVESKNPPQQAVSLRFAFHYVKAGY